MRSRLALVLPIAWIGTAAAAATGLLWIATSAGVGLSPDSVTYLLAARSLLEGRGASPFPHRAAGRSP